MKISKLILISLLLNAFAFGDWLGFRGNNGNGFVDGQLPADLNLISSNSWKVSLPGRGLSSPIIVNNLVLLTASSGPQQKNLHILAFDIENGVIEWERVFKATGRTICHEKTCVASSTMVSNGNVVVAQFSSNDIFCLDLKGNLVWLRGLTFDYPNIANGLGMSSSPVISNGVLIAQVENDADSYTFGLNLQNGTTNWKKLRPKGANWTSPIILKDKSTEWVGLQSKTGLTFVLPSNGDEFWSYNDGASTIPSSAIAPNRSVLIPSNGITAIKKANNGAPFSQIWSNNKLSPGTGSPTVSGNQVFVVNRANVLTSASVENGEINWRLRIKGPVSASPITTDKNLILFSEEGICQIIDISNIIEAKVLNEMDFQDTILCTPAANNKSLFVRSDKSLWRVSPKSKN
jgi:outer membrane protein assembly factor BamB